jgi:hypothetical protein
MYLPEGFEKYYEDDVVLKLIKSLYGTKQAAMKFWIQLLQCFKDMKYARSGADPCMYFKWTNKGLVIWLSWIDDCLVFGPEGEMRKEKKEFQERFECDDVGDVNEYVGCKVNQDEESIKFTQPVMI